MGVGKLADRPALEQLRHSGILLRLVAIARVGIQLLQRSCIAGNADGLILIQIVVLHFRIKLSSKKVGIGILAVGIGIGVIDMAGRALLIFRLQRAENGHQFGDLLPGDVAAPAAVEFPVDLRICRNLGGFARILRPQLPAVHQQQAHQKNQQPGA